MNSKKEEIISHCEYTIQWVSNLEDLSEGQWRTPIAEGKWTIAEVIGHLIPWDEYFIERIPNIINEAGLSSGDDIEEINERASIHSRESSKEEVIKEFIEVRKTLLGKINEVNDDLWEREFRGRNDTLSLYSDLNRLIQHDKSHFNQIKSILDK